MTIDYFKGIQDVAGGRLPVVALGAGVTLHRLFRHPGGDWKVAPAEFRTGRVDPPAGQREAFGLLYLADSRVTAGFEYGIIRYAKDPATGDERFEVIEDAPDPDTNEMPLPVQAATHTTSAPVGFVDLEDPSLKDRFGIDLKSPAARIVNWRQLSLNVYQVLTELGSETVVPLVGVTFETQQAGANGRNFAVYERYRDQVLTRGASGLLDRAALRAELDAL